MSDSIRVLITGAAGYLGRQLARELSHRFPVIGVDLRTIPDGDWQQHIMDIRDPGLAELMRKERITHVVHLAAVLEDSGNRERDYDIDVNGTRNVLESCLFAGVMHVTVSSSGAAYGYYADNPEWIEEGYPLRGNAEFAYSDHKRLIEELLAEYRAHHPQLAQLVLRPGTVLGATTRNLITNLWTRPRLLAVRDSDSPFVFIWDQDVVAVMAQGVAGSHCGTYNLAGDGVLTIHEIGELLGKPVVEIPAAALKTALWLGKTLGIGRYGPGQIDFLRYRPVLSNRRLKQVFGYRPQKNSEETFLFWLQHARRGGLL